MHVVNALSDSMPDGLLVVGPEDGMPLQGTGPTRLIARSAWSQGHTLIFDQELLPGAFMGAHHHTDESQGAYVIGGSIGFYVDGEETVAGPGSYVVRPPGSVHALWNAGPDTAHMLEITSPAERYQEFILGFQRMRAENADPAQLAAHAESYGTFLDDDVTAELQSRLGLDGVQIGFNR
jgi:hypothetical protein